MANYWHDFRWYVIQDDLQTAWLSLHIISRLVRKHVATQNVKDRPRFGRPSVQPNVKIRVLVDLSDDIRLQQASVLKGIGYLSTLVDRNRRERLACCRTRQNWKLQTWRRIHCSDGSKLLVRVTDGRTHVIHSVCVYIRL